MRVRVRFRYRADTGEVETFIVEDLGGTERGTDHDARHDRATADVARIIEQNARIDEVLPGTLPDAPIETPSVSEDPSRQAERGIHE